MKFAKSLRIKLTVLYLLTNIIPIGIIVFAMPCYYQSVLTRDTQTLTDATLTSLVSNIDTYLDDLDRLTLIPYFNDEVMQALKWKANPFASQNQQLLATQTLSTTFFKYLQEARTDILSTVVLPFDGSVFIAARDQPSTSRVANYPFSQQPWYKSAKEANGKVIYIDPHPQDYVPAHSASQVFSVACLIKDPDTFQPLAVIMADADTNILQKIISKIKLNVSSIIAIFGTDGQPIYSTVVPLPRQIRQEIAHKSTLIHASEDAYIPVIRQTTIAQWDVVILLSQSEINANERWLYMVGILCAIGGFCLTLLVFGFLSPRIINPFRQMMDVMRKVQAGDLQTHIVTQGEDEIAVLGNAFNTMLDQLNDLIEREYKATLSQRDAEYRALQSQIEPHFLYNTLNGFIALNRLSQRQALESAILSLSAMLRHILSNEAWVTLKDEFRFLHKYCDLQKMRFQEKMMFVIQYDDALANFKIPKVLLQPLVENAVIHGMEPAAYPCTLQVLALLKSEHDAPALWISIQDNGVGFDAQAQQDNLGLGLSNVRERLKLAYEHASLSITSQTGEGAQVVIVIPVTEGEL